MKIFDAGNFFKFDQELDMYRGRTVISKYMADYAREIYDKSDKGYFKSDPQPPIYINARYYNISPNCVGITQWFLREYAAGNSNGGGGLESGISFLQFLKQAAESRDEFYMNLDYPGGSVENNEDSADFGDKSHVNMDSQGSIDRSKEYHVDLIRTHFERQYLRENSREFLKPIVDVSAGQRAEFHPTKLTSDGSRMTRVDDFNSRDQEHGLQRITPFRNKYMVNNVDYYGIEEFFDRIKKIDDTVYFKLIGSGHAYSVIVDSYYNDNGSKSLRYIVFDPDEGVKINNNIVEFNKFFRHRIESDKNDPNRRVLSYNTNYIPLDRDIGSNRLPDSERHPYAVGLIEYKPGNVNSLSLFQNYRKQLNNYVLKKLVDHDLNIRFTADFAGKIVDFDDHRIKLVIRDLGSRTRKFLNVVVPRSDFLRLPDNNDLSEISKILRSTNSRALFDGRESGATVAFSANEGSWSLVDNEKSSDKAAGADKASQSVEVSFEKGIPVYRDPDDPTRRIRLTRSVVTKLVQSPGGEAVLKAMHDGFTGTVRLDGVSLEADLPALQEKLSKVKNARVPFADPVARDKVFGSLDPVQLLKGIRDKQVSFGRLTEAQKHILAEYFPDSSGETYDEAEVLRRAHAEEETKRFERSVKQAEQEKPSGLISALERLKVGPRALRVSKAGADNEGPSTAPRSIFDIDPHSPDSKEILRFNQNKILKGGDLQKTQQQIVDYFYKGHVRKHAREIDGLCFGLSHQFLREYRTGGERGARNFLAWLQEIQRAYARHENPGGLLKRDSAKPDIILNIVNDARAAYARQTLYQALFPILKDQIFQISSDFKSPIDPELTGKRATEVLEVLHNRQGLQSKRSFDLGKKFRTNDDYEAYGVEELMNKLDSLTESQYVTVKTPIHMMAIVVDVTQDHSSGEYKRTFTFFDPNHGVRKFNNIDIFRKTIVGFYGMSHVREELGVVSANKLNVLQLIFKGGLKRKTIRNTKDQSFGLGVKFYSEKSIEKESVYENLIRKSKDYILNKIKNDKSKIQIDKDFHAVLKYFDDNSVDMHVRHKDGTYIRVLGARNSAHEIESSLTRITNHISQLYLRKMLIERGGARFAKFALLTAGRMLHAVRIEPGISYLGSLRYKDSVLISDQEGRLSPFVRNFDAIVNDNNNRQLIQRLFEVDSGFRRVFANEIVNKIERNILGKGINDLDRGDVQKLINEIRIKFGNISSDLSDVKFNELEKNNIKSEHLLGIIESIIDDETKKKFKLLQEVHQEYLTRSRAAFEDGDRQFRTFRLRDGFLLVEDGKNWRVVPASIRNELLEREGSRLGDLIRNGYSGEFKVVKPLSTYSISQLRNLSGLPLESSIDFDRIAASPYKGDDFKQILMANIDVSALNARQILILEAQFLKLSQGDSDYHNIDAAKLKAALTNAAERDQAIEAYNKKVTDEIKQRKSSAEVLYKGRGRAEAGGVSSLDPVEILKGIRDKRASFDDLSYNQKRVLAKHFPDSSGKTYDEAEVLRRAHTEGEIERFEQDIKQAKKPSDKAAGPDKAPQSVEISFEKGIPVYKDPDDPARRIRLTRTVVRKLVQSPGGDAVLKAMHDGFTGNIRLDGVSLETDIPALREKLSKVKNARNPFSDPIARDKVFESLDPVEVLKGIRDKRVSFNGLTEAQKHILAEHFPDRSGETFDKAEVLRRVETEGEIERFEEDVKKLKKAKPVGEIDTPEKTQAESETPNTKKAGANVGDRDTKPSPDPQSKGQAKVGGQETPDKRQDVQPIRWGERQMPNRSRSSNPFFPAPTEYEVRYNQNDFMRRSGLFTPVIRRKFFSGIDDPGSGVSPLRCGSCAALSNLYNLSLRLGGLKGATEFLEGLEAALRAMEEPDSNIDATQPNSIAEWEKLYLMKARRANTQDFLVDVLALQVFQRFDSIPFETSQSGREPTDSAAFLKKFMRDHGLELVSRDVSGASGSDSRVRDTGSFFEPMTFREILNQLASSNKNLHFNIENNFHSMSINLLVDESGGRKFGFFDPNHGSRWFDDIENFRRFFTDYIRSPEFIALSGESTVKSVTEYIRRGLHGSLGGYSNFGAGMQPTDLALMVHKYEATVTQKQSIFGEKFYKEKNYFLSQMLTGEKRIVIKDTVGRRMTAKVIGFDDVNVTLRVFLGTDSASNNGRYIDITTSRGDLYSPSSALTDFDLQIYTREDQVRKLVAESPGGRFTLLPAGANKSSEFVLGRPITSAQETMLIPIEEIARQSRSRTDSLIKAFFQTSPDDGDRYEYFKKIFETDSGFRRRLLASATMETELRSALVTSGSLRPGEDWSAVFKRIVDYYTEIPADTDRLRERPRHLDVIANNLPGLQRVNRDLVRRLEMVSRVRNDVATQISRAGGVDVPPALRRNEILIDRGHMVLSVKTTRDGQSTWVKVRLPVNLHHEIFALEGRRLVKALRDSLDAGGQSATRFILREGLITQNVRNELEALAERRGAKGDAAFDQALSKRFSAMKKSGYKDFDPTELINRVADGRLPVPDLSPGQLLILNKLFPPKGEVGSNASPDGWFSMHTLRARAGMETNRLRTEWEKWSRYVSGQVTRKDVGAPPDPAPQLPGTPDQGRKNLRDRVLRKYLKSRKTTRFTIELKNGKPFLDGIALTDDFMEFLAERVRPGVYDALADTMKAKISVSFPIDSKQLPSVKVLKRLATEEFGGQQKGSPKPGTSGGDGPRLLGSNRRVYLKEVVKELKAGTRNWDTLSSYQKILLSHEYGSIEQAHSALMKTGEALPDSKIPSAQERIQRLAAWQDVGQEATLGFGRIIDRIKGLSSRPKVTYAPQSIFIGAVDDRSSRNLKGECNHLGLAYLSTLSHGSDGDGRTRFLEGLFVHSDILSRIGDGNRNVSSREFEEAEKFRKRLAALGQYDYENSSAGVLTSEGDLSLKQIVDKLAQANGDAYYQVNTGNHAMVLGKRTINGQDHYYFYDPNFAEVEFTDKNSKKAADALKKAIDGHLKQTSAKQSWNGTLGEFYDARRSASGGYKFNAYSFDPAKAKSLQAFKDLNKFVLKDEFASEVDRLEALDKRNGKLIIDGVEISRVDLYKLGASVDGKLITADTDFSKASVIRELKFSSEGIEALSGRSISDETADQIQLIRERLEGYSDPKQLLADRYVSKSADLAEKILTTIRNNVDVIKAGKRKAIKGSLWTKLNAANVSGEPSKRLEIANSVSEKMGRTLQGYGYLQTFRAIANYDRRNLTEQQIKELDKDIGLAGGGVALDLSDYAFTKLGEKLHTVGQKSQNRGFYSVSGAGTTVGEISEHITKQKTRLSRGVGRAASRLGRFAARYAGPVIGVLSAGIDIYEAYRSFSKVASTTGKKRQDAIFGGTLAVAGATVAIGTGVATGAAVAMAAAKSVLFKIGVVGMVAAAALAIGGAIYSAVRQVEQYDKYLNLSSGQKVSLGFRLFFGFGLTEAEKNKITQIRTRKKGRELYDKALAESSDKILKETVGQGVTRHVYSRGKIDLSRAYGLYTIMADNPNADNTDWDSADSSLLVLKRNVRGRDLAGLMAQYRRQGHRGVFSTKRTGTAYDPLLVDIDDKVDLNKQKVPFSNGVVKDKQSLAHGIRSAIQQVVNTSLFSSVVVRDKGTFSQDSTALINLGGGNDTVVGYKSRKNTFISSSGKKNFLGGDKDDTFIFIDNPTKFSRYAGGGGVNTMVVEGNVHFTEINILYNSRYFPAYTNAKLSNGDLIYLGGIDNVFGNAKFAERIIGSDATNILDGRGGADDIDGRGGNDIIIVRADNTVRGGSGSDIFRVQKEGQKDTTITIHETASTKDHNTILFEYEIADLKDVKLNGNNVEIYLRNGAHTTKIILMDIYTDSGSGGKRRTDRLFSLVTKDGFTLVPRWQQELSRNANGLLEPFNNKFFARYIPEADRVKDGTVTAVELYESAFVDFSSTGVVNVDTDKQRRMIKLPKLATLMLEGSSQNDTIVGTKSANLIRGFGGNDRFVGGEGSDTYAVYINEAEVNNKKLAVSKFTRTDTGVKTIDNSAKGRSVPDKKGGSKTEYDQDYLVYSVDRSKIGYRTEGNDLVIFYKPNEDRAAKVVLKNFLLGEQYRHISLIDASGASFKIGVDKDGSAYLSKAGLLLGSSKADKIKTSFASTRVLAGDGHDRIEGQSRLGVEGHSLYGGRGDDKMATTDGDDTHIGGEGKDIMVDTRGDGIFVGGKGADEIRFAANAEGLKLVDVSSKDKEIDIIWLPFALEKANFVRQGDNLLIQGQAVEGRKGKLLNVAIKDYFRSEKYRRVELRSYDVKSLDKNASYPDRYWGKLKSVDRITSTELYKTSKVASVYGKVQEDTYYAVNGTSDNDVMAIPDSAPKTKDGVVVFNGLGGNDRVRGSKHNDRINPGAGADTVDGGAGDDEFILTGANVYSDNNKDGLLRSHVDDLSGGTGTDTVSISSSGLSYRPGARFAPTTTYYSAPAVGKGEIIETHLTGHSYRIDLKAGTIDYSYNRFYKRYRAGVFYNYADTQVLRIAKLKGIENVIGSDLNDYIVGNAAKNHVRAGAGDDYIELGAGDDRADGGAGNDTYAFFRGDGSDQITDNSGDHDKIIYKDGKSGSFKASDFWFRRAGDDLEILLKSSKSAIGSTPSDRQLVRGYFASDKNKIETIEAGGKRLASANIDQLVSAMAGHSSFDYSATATGSQRTVQQEVNRLWSSVTSS
ncbi:hypothetical protein [Coralliovum pocilloporae]|uniref:hypothetical protein n=1 Tax=Coralliovum pocilloporae TaxID=3066369 RepID=UPI003306DED7